jgi:hypothetical protein
LNWEAEVTGFLLRRLTVFATALGFGSFVLLPGVRGAEPVGVQEAYEIGKEAYVYLYPLVMMDVTRKVMTNVEPGKKPGAGPMNEFAHVREYPPADFRDVVRPNFDTLYSIAWLDLTKEPMVMSTPDTKGRYYLLPLLDMWSDVFASPGARTSGTGAARFAIVPQGWRGKLPDGIQKIEAPTPYVWIIGRTQTNGPKDYAAVHEVQDGYRLSPLSRFGKPQKPAPFKPDPTVDMKTPPMEQVDNMPATRFFAYAAELLKTNPPHVTDWSQIARLKRIGFEPGKSFDAEKAGPAIKGALDKARVDALTLMNAKKPTLAQVVNGWQMNTTSMGVYGIYYLKRAIVAQVGLGANQPEDAVYPFNLADSEGKPLSGANKYVLHFAKNELPPVDAFWSVTMYDGQGFQIANPINRFAIGDRDPLKYGADGSLDVYIQSENPGPDKESNWLPAPASGAANVTMRLYAPKPEALDGRWAPPPIKRVR